MSKESEGKTVWFRKEVIEAVEEYRRKQKKIPSFSDAVNTLLKKVLNDIEEKNRKPQIGLNEYSIKGKGKNE